MVFRHYHYVLSLISSLFTIIDNLLSQGSFFQKEEKIKFLKQTLAERDALKDGSGNLPKDSLIVADFVTGEGTSDSAIGGGISVYTQSSRASASDFEFSGSYLQIRSWIYILFCLSMSRNRNEFKKAGPKWIKKHIASFLRRLLFDLFINLSNHGSYFLSPLFLSVINYY